MVFFLFFFLPTEAKASWNASIRFVKIAVCRPGIQGNMIIFWRSTLFTNVSSGQSLSTSVCPLTGLLRMMIFRNLLSVVLKSFLLKTSRLKPLQLTNGNAWRVTLSLLERVMIIRRDRRGERVAWRSCPLFICLTEAAVQGQGQRVEDQITAAIGERQAEDETKQSSLIIGRKRKQCPLSDQLYDSHHSTPPTSSTNAAENNLPVGAGEEHEMPMRKKRRSESFEKLLSLKSVKWSSGSDQAMIYSISWSVEDLEEPLSSDLEDLPPADQQVQSPPAPVNHSPITF
ncbi:uncharacterized protein LOC131537210 [Onychostoma macrolepis]|uniref:uncharacterized protein LOC131537210 n=1 Tax=Onychostoma macrolepis TaxID=369639 RepID=UPI00272DC2D0|nr:uncharacterized protein LOC131537210 [Onychostoma macrolepis]